MKADYVPSSGELTAHVRTAVDGSVRWIDRALAAPGHDTEAWDQHTFYARMILMRGLERGELLGWVLQRDGLAAAGTDRGTGLRQATAYWAEARPDMHEAIAGLRKAADLDASAARAAVRTARGQLDQARGWLTDLAEGLAATSRSVVDLDRTVASREPERSYGLDFL